MEISDLRASIKIKTTNCKKKASPNIYQKYQISISYYQMHLIDSSELVILIKIFKDVFPS